MKPLPGHKVRAIENPMELCFGTREADGTFSHSPNLSVHLSGYGEPLAYVCTEIGRLIF